MARLIDGAREALEIASVDANAIEIFRVPGSFEIPLCALKAAETGKFDAVICLGVIILRRTEAQRPRPFRVPFVPLFPILGVLFCLLLMFSLPLETWFRFFVWLVIGLAIYLLYGVHHSKLRSGVDTGPSEDEPPPIVRT